MQTSPNASNRLIVIVLLISGLVMTAAGLIAGIVAGPIYFALAVVGLFDLAAASYFSRVGEKQPDKTA
ncbi:hypothetical protein BH10ACT11_BH10ACT11_09450 [soil metagenome]